jgi:hypothetical protein
MIKRLLAFIFLTLSIGANAAVIEYTLSHVSGDSLTGTFTTDNGVYAGGSVVVNEAQVWSTGNPTRHYYYPYTFGEVVLVTPSDIPPVPLPAAAWLFISAIAGLAGAKRMSRPKGSAQSLQR